MPLEMHMRGLQKVTVHSHVQYGILGVVVACLPRAVLRAVAGLDQMHRAWLELVVAVLVVIVVVVLAVAWPEVWPEAPEGARGADNQRWG
jgi:uncharacterized membrane protein